MRDNSWHKHAVANPPTSFPCFLISARCKENHRRNKDLSSQMSPTIFDKERKRSKKQGFPCPEKESKESQKACKSRSGEFLTCHIAVVILRGLYKILQKSSFHGCWLAIAVAWRSLVVRSCLQWGRSNLVDPLGMSDPIVTWVSVWGEPGRTAPTRNT